MLRAVGTDDPKPVKKKVTANAHNTGLSGSLLNVVRSIGRGVVNTVDDTLETAISLATGSQKKAEDLTSGIDHANDAIFGPRATQGGYQFIEDASQFVTGFVGLGKLKAFKALKPVVSGAARGAVVDFAMFDPYKEQLAELVGLDALSVEKDEGPVVSRLKRTVGGLIPGVALDGLIASVRFFRASAAGDVATAAAQGKIIEDIAEGTHVASGDVAVRQTPDGRWTVDAPGSTERRVDPSTRENLQKLHQKITDVPATAAAKEREAATAAYDEALAAARKNANPTFESRWEAEGIAASINEALSVRRAANAKVSPDEMKEIFSLAKALEEANGDPEQIVLLMKEARFNFSYMDAPVRTESLLKAIGEVLSPVFDKTQGRPVVTQAESIDRALQLAGMLTREDAADYLQNAGNVLKNADANLLFMNKRVVELGEGVAKWSAVLDARPFDTVAQAEARTALKAYVNLAADVAGAESGTARGLAALVVRKDVPTLKFKGEAGAKVAPGAAEGAPDIIAGMTAVELRDVARLFRQTKQPKVLFNTLASQLTNAHLSKPATFGRGLLEYFYNSILSAPATHLGIFLSTGTVSMVEDGVRIMAGAASGNRELVREGADILSGRLIYLRQSLRGMVDAFKAGHSIIDPRPVYKAIPGVGGEVIRTMGTRPIAGADEFWRVNNNLAYVRAQAMKLARKDAAARGLTGKQLDTFVAGRADAAVKASLDPSGASRLPEAREFASLPTFSSPIDGFGRTLEEMVQKHPWLTPILPFVRTSVNVMDYSFAKGTPLGLLSENYRRIAKSGGPEAAIQNTRMVLGTAVWATAGLLAFSGSITGNGPSDPKLRKMWAASHQPYSIKIGGKWVSYRRLEPFATALGTMADAAHIIRDNADSDTAGEEGTKVFYSLISGSISAMTNKTYMAGLADFAEMLNAGSYHETKSFADRLMGTAVPNLVQLANTDPYLRQTVGMLDALKNRTPGWSTTLPAKYNVFGEPISMAPGRAHRTLSPLPFKAADGMTEDDILALDRAFTAPPTIVRFGKMTVNLHNRVYQNSKGSTLTPYERQMELVQEADLRGQIDALIASPAFKNAGDGTDVFAGGRKFVMLRDRIERVYNRAERQMLSEYPTLKQELRGLERAKRASARSDSRAESILDRLPQ